MPRNGRFWPSDALYLPQNAMQQMILTAAGADQSKLKRATPEELPFLNAKSESILTDQLDQIALQLIAYASLKHTTGRIVEE